MLESVKSLNLKQTNLKLNDVKNQKINFKSNPNNTLERTPETDKLEEKKGLSKGAKWAIGLGLTALASYVIYGITKGKVKSEKVKELTLESFKKNGKFEKGKAILADGTNYTGKISCLRKDGAKVILVYDNGMLKSSEIFKKGENGDFIAQTMKKFVYGTSGKIETVQVFTATGHASPVNPTDIGTHYVKIKDINMNKARKEAQAKSWQKKTADIKAKFDKISQNSQKTYDNNLQQIQENHELSEIKARLLQEDKIRSSLDGNMKVEINDSKSKELEELAEYFIEQDKVNAREIERTFSRPANVTASTIDASMESNKTPKYFKEGLQHRKKVANVIDELNDYEYRMFKERPFNLENVGADANGVFVDLTSANGPKVYFEAVNHKPYDSSSFRRIVSFNRALHDGDKTSVYRVSSDGRLIEFNPKYTPEIFKTGVNPAVERSNYRVIYTTDGKPAKLLEKNTKGKFKTKIRHSEASKITDPLHSINWSAKTVEHLDNGNTVIKYVKDGETLEITRDKLGKILNEKRTTKPPKSQPIIARVRL